MEEIYWITRLDGVLHAGNVLLTLSIIATVSALCYLISINGDDEDRPKAIMALKVSIPILILSILIVVFVPSKKDMFLIYGLGTTIEYVKENDRLKEIPDKAIDAIMEYLGQEEEGK